MQKATLVKPQLQLTIAEHLEELRKRLGFGLAALLVAIGLSATQAARLIEWLKTPVLPEISRFAVFSPTEPIVAYINVSVLAGLVLAMPVILWQLWSFIRPGLKESERKNGLLFIAWGSFQFALGMAFAFSLLIPASLHFLLGIGRYTFEPVISIQNYLSFVTTLMFWSGIVFELPVVLFILAKLGVVTTQWLIQQRPYAILVMFIVAAVVTPTTDPVNLFLMALPMVFLYEISIFITRWASPKINAWR